MKFDSAKAQLDRISPQRNAYRGQIQSINATIADLKQRINSERAAIGICKAARDRISADTHRYNLQSYQAALQEQYSIKNSYFSQMNMSRSEFDSALNSLRAAKERKQRAQEAFNTRLSQLKADRELRHKNGERRAAKNAANLSAIVLTGTEFRTFAQVAGNRSGINGVRLHAECVVGQFDITLNGPIFPACVNPAKKQEDSTKF